MNCDCQFENLNKNICTKMQKRKSLKLLVVMFAILILDVPRISAAKHRKQGSATTRSPPPTQAPAATQGPNSDAAKLSYGNQGPPPQQNHNQPPPPYQQHAGAPPPYQPQPGGYQQPGGAPQPQHVVVSHVQQPQSSGGLGTAGGLAVGS